MFLNRLGIARWFPFYPQFNLLSGNDFLMDRVKRIWYLSPMRAAKVQASLRIRAVSPEPSLLAHISSESRRTFRQKARSLAALNGWACAVKFCHDGMVEDTNSLDGAHISITLTVRSCFTRQCIALYMYFYFGIKCCLNQPTEWDVKWY